MTTPLETVHDVLVADPTVVAIVADRVSPLQSEEGTAFPRIVLTLITTQPFNAIDGYAGLDRVEVQVDAWSLSYAEASALARAARLALQAMSISCLSRVSDFFSPLSVLNAGAYRVGYVFEVWSNV